MNNLNIENLGKIGTQIGADGGVGAASDLKVTREMQSHGLEVPKESGQTFSDILRDSFDQVNTFQVQADSAIKELVAGRTKNIHETMLAIERADASLKLMMQVRNKVLDAYKEIMRMQV